MGFETEAIVEVGAAGSSCGEGGGKQEASGSFSYLGLWFLYNLKGSMDDRAAQRKGIELNYKRSYS